MMSFGCIFLGKNGQAPALRERADTENARVAAGTALASNGSLETEEEHSCRDTIRPEAVASWRKTRADDILEGGREGSFF
jgi:hypothetical protein